MAYDFKSENEVKEFLKNLGIEYRFGCYSEKKPDVCHLLADYLESIDKDFKKAGKVYKSNCDDYKYSLSCRKFGVYSLLGRGLHESSFKNAYEYFEKGCNLSDPDSCLHQGILLVNDNEKSGVPRNVLKGMSLLEKSCNSDNPNACYFLSGVYIAGIKKQNTKSDFEVQKNMEKAFQFATTGCKLGNIYCCANLSQMYAKGDGTAKNSELAEKYKAMALEMQDEMKTDKTLTFQEGLT